MVDQNEQEWEAHTIPKMAQNTSPKQLPKQPPNNFKDLYRDVPYHLQAPQKPKPSQPPWHGQRRIAMGPWRCTFAHWNRLRNTSWLLRPLAFRGFSWLSLVSALETKEGKRFRNSFFGLHMVHVVIQVQLGPHEYSSSNMDTTLMQEKMVLSWNTAITQSTIS